MQPFIVDLQTTICNFTKITLSQMFSSEFCGNFRINVFVEGLVATDSVYYKSTKILQ